MSWSMSWSSRISNGRSWETRWKGEHVEELQSEHVLYTKGGEESTGRVGFLVNKKIKDRVLGYEGNEQQEDQRSCSGV